jgi:hypothetical protein
MGKNTTSSSTVADSQPATVPRKRGGGPHKRLSRLAVPPTLTEQDAAKYLALSTGFLRKCRHESRGPAFVRIKRAILYRTSDLDTWLSRHLVVTSDSGR